MGQSLDRSLADAKRFQEQIRNLWTNVKRFHWTHEDYLRYRLEIIENPHYARLPVWTKENLRGYDQALADAAWNLVVFSYVLGKKRVTIKSAEWEKAVGNLHRREKAGTFTTDSGAFVWADAPDKLFTLPKLADC